MYLIDAMSKLVKKIMKLSGIKQPRNALVLGSGFGFLEELLDSFKTVFLITSGNDINVRRRNLVLRETTEMLYDLPNIDAVIVDQDQIPRILELKPAWAKSAPVLVIEGPAFISRSLNKDRLAVVLIEKQYHIWKNIA